MSGPRPPPPAVSLLLLAVVLLLSSTACSAFFWGTSTHGDGTSGGEQEQAAGAAEGAPRLDAEDAPPLRGELPEGLREGGAPQTGAGPPELGSAGAAPGRLPIVKPGGGKGFESLQEVQARCFGAPFPLVFGTKVRLPEIEVDEEKLEKKKAVGFFGGTVKNPGAKNEGTVADKALRGLAKGKRGGKSRNLLLREAGAEEEALLSGEQPGGQAAPARQERRRLLGKLDSLPLVNRCAKEKVNKDLRPGEEHLKGCIEKPHLCSDWKAAQKAAWELSGVQSLGKHINCLTVNRQCKSSSALTRAPETGRQITSSQQSMIIRSAPQTEVPRQYKTCAVVGNGPGLKMGGHRLGHIIDTHDAVIKYNLKSTGSRPGKLSDGEQQWHGTRSDYRVMNKKRSQAPLVEDWWGGLRPSTDPEHWVYWNYGTAVYYRGIKAINPLSYMVSPEYQTWLVQSYFALRTDMYRVGIASGSRPLQCPVNISSGIHGLWMAFQMCETINLYGFSWNLNMLGDRTDGPSVRVSGSHSWDFDTMVLKVLALAGKINLCTS